MTDRIPLEIDHQPDRSRFLARTDRGDAQLLYARSGESVLDLRSTYVPSGLRGEGVGEALVIEALEHARREGLSVVPTCWFVDVVLDRKPEYRDLVAGR